jgi:hypothetical protein
MMKKKKTITSITFFDGFTAQNGGMCLVFVVLLQKRWNSNVVTFLYGGGVMEKVMVEGDFFPLFFF